MLKVLSPAKVNLGLWVLGKRPDGYHNIFTVFHAVDLCDEVFLEEGPLEVSMNLPIPQEDNLVYKALLELSRRVGEEIGVRVKINKRIPPGSGLGGGSSNVATVLRAVNEMLSLGLEEEELKEIASLVSSDASFFLVGGTAVGRGRGERLQPLEDLNLKMTILVPDVQASTRRVYACLREEDMTPDLKEEEIIKALREGNFNVLENRLGEVACRLYPEIGEALRFLRSLGKKPLVSGSGSAVFYIGSKTPEVEKGALLRGWRVFEVRSWLGV